MKYLGALLLVLLLVGAVFAQQLNPGGGILVPVTGIFDWLLVGPVGTTPPAPGTVNALQYEVNGTLLSTTNLADVTVGPWVPTLFGSTTPGAPTYSVQSGSFEKIGRQVTARFYISIGNIGGMAGTVSIGNLPFPATNTPNDFGTCSINLYTGITMVAGYTTVSALVPVTQNSATLYGTGPGMALTTLQATTNVTATALLVGMCNYHI